MALQSTNVISPSEAYSAIRQNASAWKAQAQNALISVQAASVSSDFIFRMLDQLIGAIDALNTWKIVSGLDGYATAQGYSGTMSADCTTAATAATACVSWVTTTFPTSGGFITAYTLNADGTRTPRLFTTAQTAGLATALTAFIATIG